ncbi:hypothetical protein AAH446_01620 [Erwinia sp. P6884]|uniref:hypothetical protein n=1 Tax=Erwinia sp. P6884 TaxID=3141450 RepID=UPI00318C4221
MTRLVQNSYHRNKELVALNSGKRTTVGSGGFFVYRARNYAQKKGPQEDPFDLMIPQLLNG